MSTVDITAAVEAAARAQYERAAHPGACSWEDCAEQDRAVYRTAVRPHIEAAAPFVAARSLQDAAAAFLATRPSDGVRRSLEYPAVELEAMAHRHVAGARPVPAPATQPAARPVRAAGPAVVAGALRRARTVLAARAGGAAHGAA